MPVFKGSCLCRAIEYEIDGDIREPSLCHCTMCQKQHGAPFGAYSRVNWADFRFTKGEDAVEHYRSSDDVQRTFCRHCGSTLQFIRDDRPVFGLAVGTLDTPFNKKPEVQICTSSTAPWWPLQKEYRSYPEFGD